jgi:hypothetical protein
MYSGRKPTRRRISTTLSVRFLRIADAVHEKGLPHDVQQGHSRVQGGERILEDHLHLTPKGPQLAPARGAVIDEAALYDALLHHRIGGAAIDTWWDYPPRAAPRDPSTAWPFHRLDNVLLSPHVAGWTTGTLLRRTLEMARNLDRLARGEPLNNSVMKE